MDPLNASTMPSTITNNAIAHYQGEVSAQPYVKILEQPASRSLRFRYECEGRSAGSIVGASSTPENRTYPKIQVINYHGPAVVVVSCVTKEGPPYRPHPHKLVGRDVERDVSRTTGNKGEERGICTMFINNQDMTCSFTSLGIQCVKRKDIERSLQIRERCKVDPYGTGFSHRTQAGSIDLNVVRLCFQVFLKGPNNIFSEPLSPVVSESIYDKKARSDLNIMKLSHFSAPVVGGTEVILLCDKVARDDIQVWFYEERDGRIIWEMQAEFQPNDVHKQAAIAFRTPRYCNESIQQPVQVWVELRRPSDIGRGEPRPFQFLPIERDPEGLARKRCKVTENRLDCFLQDSFCSGGASTSGQHASIAVPRTLKQPVRSRIKAEPPTEFSGGLKGAEKFQCVTAEQSVCVMDQFNPRASTAVPPSLTAMSSSASAMLSGAHTSSSMRPRIVEKFPCVATESSISEQFTRGPLTVPPSSLAAMPSNSAMLPGAYSSSSLGMQPLKANDISMSGLISPVAMETVHGSSSSVTLNQTVPSPNRTMLETADEFSSAQQSQVPDVTSPLDDAMIEKFDSLDIDPSNLNLSTSLFDSANNLIETPLQESAIQDERNGNMPNEGNLDPFLRYDINQ